MSCWLFRTRSAHEGWQPPLNCAWSGVHSLVCSTSSNDPYGTVIDALDHKNIIVAIDGHTDVLSILVDPPTVDPVDGRRSVALGIAWRFQPGLCPHGDARFRAFQTGKPARSLLEFPLLVLLWVLTHVPDVAVIVLGKEGKLSLNQLAF